MTHESIEAFCARVGITVEQYDVMKRNAETKHPEMKYQRPPSPNRKQRRRIESIARKAVK